MKGTKYPHSLPSHIQGSQHDRKITCRRALFDVKRVNVILVDWKFLGLFGVKSKLRAFMKGCAWTFSSY